MNEKNKFTLRPYQEKTLTSARASVAKGKRRPLIVSPTGSGKMVMAATMLASAQEKGGYGIFLADRRELVKQCERTLEGLFVDFGTIMRGAEADAFSRIQVISKDTLYSRAFRQNKMDRPKADLIIVDEAHKTLGKSWQAIIDEYPNAVTVGFTATPCRTDGKGLGNMFNDMIIAASYEELRAGGHLVPTRIFAGKIPDLSKVSIDIKTGDYVAEGKNGVSKIMDTDEMVGDIYRDWKRFGDDRLTVVFASSVAHSLHIEQLFQSKGVKCGHIDGTTESERRDEILGSFHDGEIRVVTNYGCLTEGWDEPECKCAIIARPTRSFALWRQMGGRIQRPFGNFEDATVIDHTGTSLRYGYPDVDVDWQLDAEIPIQLSEKKKAADAGSPEPGSCPKCTTVFLGRVCPMCGHERTIPPKAVALTKGELKELNRGVVDMKHIVAQTWTSSLYRAGRSNKTFAQAMYLFREAMKNKGLPSSNPPEWLHHRPKNPVDQAKKVAEVYPEYGPK